jgi:hypothetical protein
MDGANVSNLCTGLGHDFDTAVFVEAIMFRLPEL